MNSPSALSPLRFRGDASHSDYPAVRHMLRTYALHLGTDFIELGPDTSPDLAADIHWGLPPANKHPTGLYFPARKKPPRPPALAASPSAGIPSFIFTCGGYPAPREGELLGLPRDVLLESSGPGAEADLAAYRHGDAVVVEWDLLSFCADILYKRFDALPAYRSASREARYADLSDRDLGLDREPWVDRWMFRLLGWLPRFAEAVGRIPGEPRIWLTHDLDNLAKWRPRSVAGQILRTPGQILRGRLHVAARQWREILTRVFTGRDPYDNLDGILAMEGKRRSANFFLVNGRDHLFHRYDLTQPRFRRVLESCLKKEMDVGLHGQVQHIGDGGRIQGETDKLAGLAGKPIHLNRQHYLRWDSELTLRHLAAAGIRLDSTLGYNDTPGFRCGTARPFPWFDLKTNRPVALIEAPLILAEFHLYDPQAFDRDAVRAAINAYLETVARQGGVFTVLFHNQYFHAPDYPGHAEVYRDLLSLAEARRLPDFHPEEYCARYLGAHG